MRNFHFSNPEIELVPGSDNQAFLLKKMTKPRFDFIWHLHLQVELTYIRSGFGVRYIGNSIEPFFPGDLCLLGGNLPHAYGSHPRNADPCCWVVIHFLPSAWGEAFWELVENRRIAALLRASGRGLHFSGNKSVAVEEKILALQAEHQSSARRLPLFLEILQLLCGMRHHSLNAAPSPTDPDADMRIGDVLRWLEENAFGQIRQSDAADLIGMSSASFSRFFHQKTGRLFSRHVNEIRVARVCAELATTEKSITEIAFESGFNNLSNFNRRFNELIGMTPQYYRRSNASGFSV